MIIKTALCMDSHLNMKTKTLLTKLKLLKTFRTNNLKIMLLFGHKKFKKKLLLKNKANVLKNMILILF
jgi:hypothetical protein